MPVPTAIPVIMPHPQTQTAHAETKQQRLFEDQQRMIILYQQALEQILKYRHQYFEEALQMREHVIKEREQQLE